MQCARLNLLTWSLKQKARQAKLLRFRRHRQCETGVRMDCPTVALTMEVSRKERLFSTVTQTFWYRSAALCNNSQGTSAVLQLVEKTLKAKGLKNLNHISRLSLKLWPTATIMYRSFLFGIRFSMVVLLLLFKALDFSFTNVWMEGRLLNKFTISTAESLYEHFNVTLQSFI